MRDMLRISLARSLRALPAEDRLQAALPVVCGTALGSRCEVLRLDEEHVLYLRVREDEWLQPLLGMRDVLTRDLARTAGVSIAAIRIEGAPQPGGTRRWQRPRVRSGEPNPPSSRPEQGVEARTDE